MKEGQSSPIREGGCSPSIEQHGREKKARFSMSEYGSKVGRQTSLEWECMEGGGAGGRGEGAGKPICEGETN